MISFGGGSELDGGLKIGKLDVVITLGTCDCDLIQWIWSLIIYISI